MCYTSDHWACCWKGEYDVESQWHKTHMSDLLGILATVDSKVLWIGLASFGPLILRFRVLAILDMIFGGVAEKDCKRRAEA